MISKSMADALKNSSLIRKMFEEGNRLKKIYGQDKVFDFSLGNPDLEPPVEVKAALRELVLEEEQGLHKYMNNAGYESTRRAVADRHNRVYETGLEPGSLIMTVGAAGALNVALKIILDPEDEVLVLTPYFVEYFHYIKNHGGRAVVVDCKPEDFSLDLEAIAQAIGPKTKALILNSPNNPSGAIYTEDSLRALNDLLKAQDHLIYVISDEPYREILFDGNQAPNTMDLIDNLLLCYSWSKALALPGDRIGYLAVSPRCDYENDLISAAVLANRSLGFVNAPSIMQRVVERAIDARVDMASYQRRCDLMYGILMDAGYECLKPQGALYLFPKSPIKDDFAFVDILARHNILAVPGSAFGMKGYFRLTFCVDEKIIESSRQAFALALKDSKNI